ncbi:MAG: hypothetical protein Hyperionvirus9_45 [Hyperionvirus sp.]|uniref:RING-type domain-containing protein n=1 Tax=Hyperionvirus sp. TaxID=2487770 RepID=A0A3G5A8Q4_9VIRU|nr:MAG: hypothetical protein Hyperionvirus9_45 [Hyperionvirus sp.]
MAALDSRFYSEIYSDKHEDVDDKNVEVSYTGYVPQFGHPMALFSESNGLALAVLELRYQDADSYAKGHETLITELTSDDARHQAFQGVVTQDNQKVQFVITNLCSDYLNFNLMKYDKKVTDVNPMGLNEINELRPYESYAIKSDQTNGNKVIMLKSHVAEKTGKGVTLGDEIAGSNKVGTYLYLSVVPKYGNKELAALFASTFWKPVDSFVVKTKSAKHVPYHTTGGYMQFDGHAQMGMPPMLETANHHRFRTGAAPRRERQMLYKSNGPTLGFHADLDYKNLSISDEESGSEECGLENFSLEPMDDMPKMKSQILNSKVANIVTGDETIKVNSVQTNIMYDYDLHSMPCVLGLSVMSELKLAKRQSPDVILSDMKLLVQSYITNTFKTVIAQMKIYTEEKCCVCLTEKPDGVFYRCGHKCTDLECAKLLDKCPFCRTHISAFVNDK